MFDYHTSRRKFLQSVGLSAVATSSVLPAKSLWAANANDEINIGFVGCGGRFRGLVKQFGKLKGVNLVAFCDPDSKRLEQPKKDFPKASFFADMRELFELESVDAVVVATGNHWHCLASIWAMQAGKHVYVEKPLSHSQWEGEQTVRAAEKFNKICQIGTQQRSDPMQVEIKDFLHEQKALGEIKACRVNRYGVRKPIGKRSQPLEIPSSVNYDLWLGPAAEQPLYRNSLHYDWHWDWNTGSGEMGNWGVHVLDDVRNNIFRDSVALPKRIFGGGGRVAWDDAANTPNVSFVYFDTGSIPVVIGLSNLPAKKGDKKSPDMKGPSSGYVAYCEGGRFEGQRGRAVARDRKTGKVIREFKGNNGDVMHQQNFIDAIRAGDASILNADVVVGNHSTGWCNLANIAYRCGANFKQDDLTQVKQSTWRGLLKQTEDHLAQHGLTITDEAMRLSPMLTLNKDGLFEGENADKANALLKREYREGYEVAEI